ncbi:MAG TPA: sialidase family protein [Thermoanaerobaculia bacterium]|nr:sialidase family protein [Thermoanaerobaculia bacterium]
MRKVAGISVFLAAASAMAIWAAGVVGPNFQVSPTGALRRYTSDIRMFPGDPNQLLVASEESSGRQIQYRSLDAGANWDESVLPLVSTDVSQSGPSVDWTTDHKAWTTTVGTNAAGTQSRGRAYLSLDLGLTWTPEATFSGSQAQVGWPRLWSDKSGGSPFVNNLYVIWHNGNQAYMTRRTGAGWQPLLPVSGAESVGSTRGADVRTNLSGDVFGYWPTAGNRKIFVVKSANGGVSYGAPVQAADTFDSVDIGIPAGGSHRVPVYTTGAAWRTALKNNVYVAWTDLSGDVNCTSPAFEPGTNAASTCKTRIWFARSLNGGLTFQPKQLIFGSAFIDDQFNPWMVVDPSTGVISIVFYIANGPGRQNVNLVYSASYNDGVSWATTIPVTTASSTNAIWGNYNGLTSFRCYYNASWTDRRNGVEQIWSARIKDCV